MNRPYRVICHMAMSIDGRAAGHYLSAVEFGPYGKAYEDTLTSLRFGQLDLRADHVRAAHHLREQSGPVRLFG